MRVVAEETDSEIPSGDSTLFANIARFAVRRRVAILVGYAALFLPALLVGQSVLRHLSPGGFEDPDRESWQAYALMQRELGASVGDIIALYSTNGDIVDEPQVMNQVLGAAARAEAHAAVGGVTSFYTTGAPHFVSHDRTRTFLLVDMRGDDAEKAQAWQQLRPLLTPAPDSGIEVMFTGLIPGNLAVLDTIQHDLFRAELIAIPLTGLLLLLVFGSLSSVAALLAFSTTSVVFAFALLRGVVEYADVSIFAINTITILGFGLAVDYSLFLVNRFREELPARGTEGAVIHAVATTGRAVAFSGVTVAASLCGLFAFEQMMLRSLAFGGILVVLLTVLLSLTLLPALLAVLGPRIDALRLPFLKPRDDSSAAIDANLWARLAFAAMKRPVVVIVVVSTALLALALPFADFNGSLADSRLLPEGTEVRRTNGLLASEFIPHQGTPYLVLVTTPGEARTKENLERLAALSEQMAKVPGVARVDGVFTFLPGVSSARVIEGLLKAEEGTDSPVLAQYLKGSWMRFSVISQHPFDDPRSLETVARLRALSRPELPVQVAGYSAALVDLKSAIRERAPIMVLAVALVMFIVLFLVFGSVTLPIKAMVMNSLSLTASFGAIVWVFQEGRFAELLHYEPLGISDATLPLVMFAAVFGLSMDYEVLILARVREEYLRTGDNTLAVARGLARTGRLITSAAALMVVVVAAFSTSQILFMKTLGFGMALAIAIDATVVRALLVPALMRVMGKWNWWAPAPLVKLWRKSGMSDH